MAIMHLAILWRYLLNDIHLIYRFSHFCMELTATNTTPHITISSYNGQDILFST